MPNTIRIIGLDPGLNRTGWGVVACSGARIVHVAHGTIAPRATLDFAGRLLHLFEALEAVVRERMGAAAALTVPLDVSVGTGRSWHDAAH